MKHCPRCDTTKPFDEFNRNKRNPDGFAVCCRVCARAYKRAWFQQQTDEWKAKKRAYWRERYQENETFREHHKDKNKERFRTNPDKRTFEPIEQNVTRNRIWRTSHSFKSRMYTHKRRTRMCNNGGNHTEQEWCDLCNRYGNVCLCCGEAKPLTVDHIVPISKGGSNSIDNIQPLCGSCNTRKKARTIDYR